MILSIVKSYVSMCLNKTSIFKTERITYGEEPRRFGRAKRGGSLRC